MGTKWLRGGRTWGVVGLAVAVTLAAGVVPAGAGGGDRGYMGVYMQELTGDIREGLDLGVERGVLVSGIEEDSPAARGGLEDGDVIIELGGRSVHNPDDLRDLVRERSPGDVVDVLVIRDGERRTFAVTLGEQPQSWSFDFGDGGFEWLGDTGRHRIAGVFGGPQLGVRASEIDEDLAGYFDAEAGEGILVLGVVEESVAEAAGVKSGDVITKVNDEPIRDVGDLRASLHDFEEGDAFEVTVLRKGRTETLDATMNDQSVKTFWSGDHPRVHVDRLRRIDREDIEDVLEELRGEIKELKQEIRKIKEDV